jgi:pilus assembly protein Flp/PilA
MNNIFLKLYVRLHELKNDEQGQDLVEYALLLTMISMALISAIGSIAHAVNLAFTNISTSLA